MRDKAKVRRAIVIAAINECQRLLVPYKVTRPWDYDAVWRIISQVAVDQDTHNRARHYAFGDIDIYEFCWKLDYYAYECTTSYMDIMAVLRRALTVEWLIVARTQQKFKTKAWSK